MTPRPSTDVPDPATCPEYPEHVQSLLGVLHYQRAHMPERVVCHRIIQRRDGLASASMTVDELVARATRAAAHLEARGVRAGDRVIVSLSDPHDFLVALFGALITGASAVPLPTVGEAGAPASFAARVRGVCADCDPAVAIVEGHDRFVHAFDGTPPGIVLLEPRTLDGAVAPASVELRDRTPGEAAVIQYTSGSTGTPKGVVVTHGNILANCRAIRDATGYSRADRMVSWLPLHHDMGLVGGLLTSVYCAAETWLMPPVAFLGRPVGWLEAITRFSATLTVAPTFAYSLCARKIPAKQLAAVDLSSLRLAYVGAEPVDSATLDAFVERFGAYGLTPTAMYPVYGLAEATLAVAFPAPGAALRRDLVDRQRLALDGLAVPVAAGDPCGVTFVSVGRPLPRHRVEIVCRDTGVPLPDRRVGELVVEGASVSPRYFADPVAPSRVRLHTGDLGYTADGQLYVVDRIKDLVLINGQSYAPSDLESAATKVTGLRQGRIVAFSSSRKDGGTEALHIVAEANPRSWRSPHELERDVRHEIRQDIGLAVATVTIVVPGTLERTSSGKVKRRACALAHRDGTLVPVRTQTDVLVHWLVRRRDVLRAQALGLATTVLGWIGDRLSAYRRT